MGRSDARPWGSADRGPEATIVSKAGPLEAGSSQARLNCLRNRGFRHAWPQIGQHTDGDGRQPCPALPQAGPVPTNPSRSGRTSTTSSGRAQAAGIPAAAGQAGMEPEVPRDGEVGRPRTRPEPPAPAMSAARVSSWVCSTRSMRDQVAAVGHQGSQPTRRSGRPRPGRPGRARPVPHPTSRRTRSANATFGSRVTSSRSRPSACQCARTVECLVASRSAGGSTARRAPPAGVHGRQGSDRGTSAVGEAGRAGRPVARSRPPGLSGPGWRRAPPPRGATGIDRSRRLDGLLRRRRPAAPVRWHGGTLRAPPSLRRGGDTPPRRPGAPSDSPAPRSGPSSARTGRSSISPRSSRARPSVARAETYSG